MRLPPSELVAAFPTSAAVAAPAAARRVPQPASRSRLARNLTALASGQIVTWTLTSIWTVFVPNRLGPNGMGELGVATALANVLVTALGLGIAPLLVKQIARDHWRAPGLVGSALLLRLLLVPIAVAVVAVYLLFVAHAGAELSAVVWLSLGAAAIQLVATPLVFGLQGLERMQYTAYSDVLTKAATAFGGVTLVLLGFGVVPLMWLTLALTATAAFLSWIWARPHFRVDWRPNFSRMQFLAVHSLPYWASGLVLTFYMWIDLLMLDRMTPLHVVGWYSVPTRLFSTLLVVPTILSTVLLPRLSRAFRDGHRAFAAEARPALEVTLIFSLPIAVGCALVARQGIWVLYGGTFLPAAPVLSVLALCVPATYLNTLANQVLIAANRQLAWTKIMVWAAVANPVINLALIQLTQSRLHNGAVGAALALLATELGMAAAALVLMPNILTGRSWLRVARSAVATAGMGVAVWLVLPHAGLFVQVGTGLVSFTALGLLLRILSPEEMAELRRVPEMLRRP
jgi:O-antigen/teichoic acid export membrane protein